jgi:hypothetical protein
LLRGFRQPFLIEFALQWREVFVAAASSDGKELFYDQAGPDESSILLVESYR